MKRIVKSLCVVLSVFVLLSVSFIGCKKGGLDTSDKDIDYGTFDIEFDPLSAGDYVPAASGLPGAMTGRTNDQLLYQNPDRGFRTTISFSINQKHPDPEHPGQYTDTCDRITRNADGKVVANSSSKCKHDIRYYYCNLDEESKREIIDYLVDRIYLSYSKTDYKSKLLLLQSTLVDLGPVKELPEGVFEAYDLLFDKLRTRNCKVLFRLGYHGIQLNWQASEANKQEHLKKGASEENMLAHIDQLAPFLIENKDVIAKISSGFIGSGGEMAYNYQYPIVNYDNIIKAIVEKICVPMGITYSVRMPEYKLNLLENDPDYEYAHLIGFNNDAMFGETENYGWNSGCLQYNHNFDAVMGQHKCERVDNYGTHYKNDWWEYMCQTAAYTPQSGEMFHRSGTTGAGKEPTGLDIILECVHHRYMSMSHWNSYIEDGTSEINEDGISVAKQSVMQNWINDEYVTPELLDEYGIIYDPAWFYDDDGVEVYRNPYEFIRDYLGYRVQLKKVSIENNVKAGATIKLNLSLVNYGFAAAFNMESGFAILDEDYNLVSEVKAGSPEKWYSHDPEDYKSSELLTHTVEGEVTIPSDGGKYYIAFYLRNSAGEYAHLANDPASVPFEGDGFSILYEIN